MFGSPPKWLAIIETLVSQFGNPLVRNIGIIFCNHKKRWRCIMKIHMLAIIVLSQRSGSRQLISAAIRSGIFNSWRLLNI